MSISYLTDYLRSFHPLTTVTLTSIKKMVSSVRYSRGQILAHPGGTIGEIWFIQQGIIKSYQYDADGKATVFSIWQDNELAIVPDCIFGGKRSGHYIEVVEDSMIEILDGRQLNELAQNHLEISGLNQQLILTALKKMEEKTLLISYNAEQRYRYFADHFPWSRISVADTAAYLGLTRETISQIRNKKTA